MVMTQYRSCVTATNSINSYGFYLQKLMKIDIERYHKCGIPTVDPNRVVT